MKTELPPGTLDVLILRTLAIGPLHGYGIAQHLQRVSQDVLQVGEGTLYPALQRLQLKGWIASEWRQSPTGRRARYYELTPAGQEQLGVELAQLERLIGALASVIRTA